MKVLVLGGTGMLGQMVSKVLREDEILEVAVTSREVRTNQSAYNPIHINFNNVDTIVEDIEKVRYDWIVNCIGITKPHIKEKDSQSIANAILVNSAFPLKLAKCASCSKIVHITTDCVFSGQKNTPYIEEDVHDAMDVYGRSKSMGEFIGKNVYNLRCSIIGPEWRDKPKFLFDIMRSQPKNAMIAGFINHQWNGITTLGLAKCIRAIIKCDLIPPATLHLFSSKDNTKFDVVRKMLMSIREDISIDQIRHNEDKDMRLGSLVSEAGAHIWRLAGYNKIPDLDELLLELFTYMEKDRNESANASGDAT